MPWWRLTEYKPEYVDKVYEYIEQAKDTYEKFIKAESDKSTWYQRIVKVNLPKIESVAIYIWCSLSTLYKRKGENKEFSEALDEVMLLQKERLMDNWLWWDYNPTITKLMLSSNHGMSETTKHEHTGKDWAPIESYTYDVTKMTPQEIEEARKKFLAD